MPWDIFSKAAKDLHAVSVRVCNLIFIHRPRSSPHSEVNWLSHSFFIFLNFPTHSHVYVWVRKKKQCLDLYSHLKGRNP